MISVIRRLVVRYTHPKAVVAVVETHEAQRAELDRRLEKVIKAAVNGDEDWFLSATDDKERTE